MSRWLVCMTLLALQGTPGQPASPRPNDDRDVIAAVFAHTVQPEADQYRRDPRPLKVLAQTLGSCTVRTNWTCLPVERLEILRSAKRPPAIGYTDSVGLEPGELMPDEAVRLELIASVTERNRTRQTLAMNASPAVTLVPESDEAELLRDRDLTRYAGFSLPGYTSDGHALVYGVYACGARCGKSWFFVLDRDGANWRVRARYMLAIR